jgi:hypothetical protein
MTKPFETKPNLGAGSFGQLDILPTDKKPIFCYQEDAKLGEVMLAKS